MDWLREKVATKVDLSDLPPKFGEPEGSLLAIIIIGTFFLFLSTLEYFESSRHSWPSS